MLVFTGQGGGLSDESVAESVKNNMPCTYQLH